ncbi:MAG: FAD:protein FMN transferase, partial [Rhodothermales bacterium]
MGVQVRIVLYAPGEPVAAEAARAAFGRVAALEDVMSDYRPASELMRLSAQFSDPSGGPPVPVSDDLFAVLTQAQRLARISEGAFDVTVGPHVKLWREARRTGRLPPRNVLKAAAKQVGWRHVRLDSVRQTVQLAIPGMQLDLGGIAKGYAADEAIATLTHHGIDQALVEIGGDIVVSGPPPGQTGWRIR